MKVFRWLWLMAACGACGLAWSQPLEVVANDTVSVQADERLEGGQTLADIGWDQIEFGVSIHELDERDYDAKVTFDSPRPNGDAGIDEVVLRWYRPVAGGLNEVVEDLVPAPAVLLVHTLHPDMPVATMLARGLRQRGVHAFVIELPGYASRVGAERRMTGVTTLVHAAQAVSDCRRAFDVIGALGEAGVADIDPQRIAIQGTSLGSFVATSAAALDGCFSQTFLFLSGGDGVDILETGQKDAFHVRGALRHYGYTGDKLRDLLDPVEPLRLAHRLDPETTWMINARNDTVVPAKNARRLAEAIGLDPEHHVWLNGNHYTAFLLLPGVLDHMKREIGVVDDEVAVEADEGVADE